MDLRLESIINGISCESDESASDCVGTSSYLSHSLALLPIQSKP